MKKFELRRELQRLLPPGFDSCQKEPRLLLWGLLLCGGWSLYTPAAYWNQRQLLFRRVGGQTILIPGRSMPPFSRLALPGLWGLGLFLLLLMGLGLAHMRYHRTDSMSIYLMKRLPDPWEYHRRCWGIPLLGAGLGLSLTGLLLVIYYAIYRFMTPASCLL